MQIETKHFSLEVYPQGDEKSDKLALLLPGKLDSGQYTHLTSHAELLASLGYYAIAFDPPGTRNSGGDISLYTMTNYLKAINELIKYFGNRPTFLLGHSRGGSMAVLGGITNNHVTHFGAIMSGYTMDPKVRKNYPDEERKKRGYKIQMRDEPPGSFEKTVEYKLPYAFLEDQIQYDMTDGLRTCNKPKLFIAGLQDKLQRPITIKAGYDLSAKPKKYHEVDFHHDYRYDHKTIKEVNKFISHFIMGLQEV